MPFTEGICVLKYVFSRLLKYSRTPSGSFMVMPLCRSTRVASLGKMATFYQKLLLLLFIDSMGFSPTPTPQWLTLLQMICFETGVQDCFLTLEIKHTHTKKLREKTRKKKQPKTI